MFQHTPFQGDAYDFDAPVHNGYEHSVPKDNEALSRRMVIILRAGDTVFVDTDTGRPAHSLKPPVRRVRGPVFGAMPDRLVEVCVTLSTQSENLTENRHRPGANLSVEAQLEPV